MRERTSAARELISKLICRTADLFILATTICMYVACRAAHAH